MNNKYYQEIISEQKVEDIWSENYKGVELDLNSCKKTMNQMILSSEKYIPDSIALTYFGKTMTNAQLQENIRIAAIAYRNMGIKEGDLIYIFELNTPETLISIYALNLIGAVPEFFNMIGMTPAKLKEDINKYNVKWMLTSDIFYDAYKNILHETTIEKVVVNSVRDSFDKITDFMYMTQLKVLDKALTLKDKECIKKSKILLDKLSKVEQYALSSKADKKYSFHKRRLENEKIITWSEFISTYYRDEILIPAKYEKDKITNIFHTGGTTGMYKYIGATDFNLNAQSLIMTKQRGIDLSGHNDIGLQIIPPMVALSLSSIHFAQYMNINSILIPTYDKEKFVDLLLKYKCNHVFVVPAFAKTLIDNPKLKGKDLSFLKSLPHGGEGITAEEDKAIDDTLEAHGAGRVSFHGFGQNELCGAFTSNANIRGKEKIYGSCGFPFIGCKIAILDPVTKKVLGYGKDENGNDKCGSFYLTGPGLSKGYIRNDEDKNLERRLILDGEEYFDTGDIAHLDEDGRLWYDTRLERIIRTEGGNKVFATPLETQIKKVEEIKEICVVPIILENNCPKISFQISLRDTKTDIALVVKKMEEIILKEFNEFYLATSYNFHSEDLPVTAFGKIDFVKLTKEEQKYYDSLLAEKKEYPKIR